MGAERANHVGDEGGLKHLEVVADGGAADFAWSQAATQESVAQIGTLGVPQVFQTHRCQPNVSLPSCQSVFELSRRSQSGRTGGEHSDVRVVIRCDLQQFGGIWQPVDLVQHNTASAQSLEKSLNILHHSPRAWQLAVEIFDVLT